MGAVERRRGNRGGMTSLERDEQTRRRLRRMEADGEHAWRIEALRDEWKMEPSEPGSSLNL